MARCSRRLSGGERPRPPGTPRGEGLKGLLEPNFYFAPEYIELGEIGKKAGKPGKKYLATRFIDPNVRTFRIPMVRRMDASGIQLGYRLQVSVGSEEPNSESLVLAKFDAVGLPKWEDRLAPFPSAPLSLLLVTDKATVYDVIQSDHFTEEEEERFERGEFNFARQRLFIDPRPGSVAIRFDVTFEIDLHDPGQYIGYADVEIVNLNEEATDGFILGITVFEEAKTAVGSYMTITDPKEAETAINIDSLYDPFEEQKEIIADQMTFHMVPSYLVPEDDYFKDRLAGLMVFDKSINEIKQTVNLIPKPWERGGGEPM